MPDATTLLVQSVIAATGSSRNAAALLGVSRDTIHTLRDGGTVRASVAQKINDNFLSGITSKGKTGEAWTRQAIAQRQGEHGATPRQGEKIIKARVHGGQEILSKLKNPSARVKQAIKDKESKAKWDRQLTKQQKAYQKRAQAFRQKGQAPPSKYGSP